VIGTHSDLPSVKAEERKKRTAKIKQLFSQTGLNHPVDCLEVSSASLENADALQSAVYFAPLMHSYMGEKLPKTYQVVEKAIHELAQALPSFPIVSLEKIVEHCTPSMILDQGVVKVALRILDGWGRCLFSPSSASASASASSSSSSSTSSSSMPSHRSSRLVVLDPSFYFNEILFKVLDPSASKHFQDGVLPHSALEEIWASIDKGEKGIDRLVMAMELIENQEVCFRITGGSKEKERDPFLSQSSFFPHLAPSQPPSGLFSSDPSLALWPSDPPPEILEVSQLLELNVLPPELPSRLFVRLHRAITSKAIWSHGFYFEKLGLQALVEVERGTLFPGEEKEEEEEKLVSQQQEQEGSASDIEMKEIQEQRPEAEETPLQLPKPSRKIKIQVRGTNRFRCRKLLQKIIEQIQLLVADVFCEVTISKLLPSPHDPTSYLLLEDVERAFDNSQDLLCPSTKAKISPQELLIKAGMQDKPDEKGNRSSIFFSELLLTTLLEFLFLFLFFFHVLLLSLSSFKIERFWWNWFVDERWTPIRDEANGSYSRLLFIENKEVRDMSFYDKLKLMIGSEEIERVKYAYAIHNPKLISRYEEYLKFLKEKIETRPENFRKETWKKKSDLPRREYLLKRLEELLSDDNSVWNEEVYLFSHPRIPFPSSEPLLGKSSCSHSISRSKGTRSLGNLSERLWFDERQPWIHRKRFFLFNN